MWKIKGTIPYYIFVFASSFLQMGLFLFFEKWLFMSYSGVDFLLNSALLQGLFLLPYLFMLSPAANFSNIYPKEKVIAWSSLAIAITMISIATCYSLGYQSIAFWQVLILASAFAINSPAKYGVLKEMYGNQYLTYANAYLQGIAVFAIVCVSLLMMGISLDSESYFQLKYFPWLFVGMGIIGTIATFLLPKVGQSSPSMKVRSIRRMVSATWSNPLLRVSIIGLSLFWGIAQVFILLSQDFSGENILTLLRYGLFFSAVGMVLGSFIAARASRNFVETGLIAISVLGGSVSMLLIALFSNEFLHSILFGLIGFFFGVFSVILNSLLQQNTRPDSSGRILAVSNMMQMLFLGVFLGLQAFLLHYTSIEKSDFFIILAVLLLISSGWALSKTPQALIRACLRTFFAFRYKLKNTGIDNIPSEGPVLLLGNHSSFIDWAVLQMVSPRPLRMASNNDHYERWYFRWILRSLGVIRIQRRDPAPAMWAIRKALQAGEAVVIFPEGEVAKSPNISRFSIDYSTAIKGLDISIVPFYIQGLWGGSYSYMSECVMFGPAETRVVSVAFGKKKPATTSEYDLRNALRELSMKAWQLSISYYPTIAPLWIRACKKMVGSKVAIYSPTGDHVTGFKLIRLVLAYGSKFKKITHKEQNIGFLFPPGWEGVSSLLSIWTLGKTSVNLNYTAGVDTVLKCIENADVKTVVTSWAFLDKIQKRGTNFFQIGSVCKLICIEDIDKMVSPWSWFRAQMAAVFLPARLIELFYFKRAKLSDTAVVLFSSGSEGTPKGVMLTHKNMVGNVQQADSIFTIRPNDVMLAELPLFHSFGLTATILMSLLDGIPMVTCADPTDVKTMARVCAEFKATILIGTPTFLRALAVNRWVHPMCFKHMRLVLSGAEKLRPEIRDLFARKFKKEVYEGYGCTETAPVATFNSEDFLLDDFITMEPCSNLDSVGVPIPGTFVRIVDPDTNEDLPQGQEGMVLIGGCQIMKGYLKDPERTATAIIEQNGIRWYRTGDKGRLDPDGFLTLVDRYSRFAKLGGEMISLGAVESRINDTGILVGCEYLATSVPDEAKGEKIVLLYHGEKDADTIHRELRKSGIPQMMLPGRVFLVDAVPKLGSGKWDFTGAKKLAKTLAGLD